MVWYCCWGSHSLALPAAHRAAAGVSGQGWTCALPRPGRGATCSPGRSEESPAGSPSPGTSSSSLPAWSLCPEPQFREGPIRREGDPARKDPAPGKGVPEPPGSSLPFECRGPAGQSVLSWGSCVLLSVGALCVPQCVLRASPALLGPSSCRGGWRQEHLGSHYHPTLETGHGASRIGGHH